MPVTTVDVLLYDVLPEINVMGFFPNNDEVIQ